MDRKILILICLLVVSSVNSLKAQLEGKNFSLQIMAGHNDWSASSVASVDGVVFNYARSSKDLTFVSGLGASWHPNQKITISLNMEFTNLTQRYLVYDEEGETFAGEPLIKAITFNSQPRFFGINASYQLIAFKDFHFSLLLGADLLSTKLQNTRDFNFNDATQKLSDVINISQSAFKASQFNLSYGATLSYKRYFLRAVFKEDFNRSITSNVRFGSDDHEFQNYWKMTFIQFGATVFRF